MLAEYWGLLAPEFISRLRRSNTLGLGNVVRSFNNLAVPGLGGVKFGKQVFLALLGILVAERVRDADRKFKCTNIQVANALEAIACWVGLKGNDWERDWRLRGSQKLTRDAADSLYFARVRQAGFYVSQPMRMSTLQILPVLNFVESRVSRFNYYHCTEIGEDFISAATEGISLNRKASVSAFLEKWVIALNEPMNLSCESLRKVLSPLEPLPEKARRIFLNKLLRASTDSENSRQRRHGVWRWIGRLLREKHHGDEADWNIAPAEIDEGHWRDLRAGSLFFNLRGTALDTLQMLENTLARHSSAKMRLSENALRNIDLGKLKKAAQAFLDFAYDEPDAVAFAQECLVQNPESVVSALVKRDGTGLWLSGDAILRGRAFRGDPNAGTQEEEKKTDSENAAVLPPGVSARVGNMLSLYADFADISEQFAR